MSKCIIRKLAPAGVAAAALIVAGLALSACAELQKAQTAVQNFEAKAAPIVASACADFRRAEANPLVNAAIQGGSAALGIGSTVASIQSFGDGFCTSGPPATDTTAPAQQASWLADLTRKLLDAAGVR